MSCSAGNVWYGRDEGDLEIITSFSVRTTELELYNFRDTRQGQSFSTEMTIGCNNLEMEEHLG